MMAALGMVVVIFHFLKDECKKSRNKKTGKQSKKTRATWWPGERRQDVEESTLAQLFSLLPPSLKSIWLSSSSQILSSAFPKELSHLTSILPLCYY